MDILHIYGQEIWHADAFIIGDVKSLTKLRDSLNRAIENANADATDHFANDGEGYNLYTICVTDEKILDKLDVQYTDPIAQGNRSNFSPHDLLDTSETVKVCDFMNVNGRSCEQEDATIVVCTKGNCELGFPVERKRFPKVLNIDDEFYWINGTIQLDKFF